MKDGTTFFDIIPYNTVFIDTKIEDKSDDIQNRYTILIAEDEEVNYLFIKILLLDKLNIPCRILHAMNGQEAVKLCKNNSDIDFVLMDIRMPKMNGYEATTQIKTFRPDLPVIVQTAYSTQEDKMKAFKAGCNDFISKPISKEKLRIVLKKHSIMKSN